MRGLFLTRRVEWGFIAWWPGKLERLWHRCKVAYRAGLSQRGSHPGLIRSA